MEYKFNELNTVNIWNIYDKVWDGNAAIKFCQRYGLLDKLLIVRFTEQRMFWKNTKILISGFVYRKGHQHHPKVCLREGSCFQGSRISISTILLFLYCSIWATQRRLFIAYHWTIYSPKYGNTFRAVGAYGGIRALIALTHFDWLIHWLAHSLIGSKIWALESRGVPNNVLYFDNAKQVFFFELTISNLSLL